MNVAGHDLYIKHDTEKASFHSLFPFNVRTPVFITGHIPESQLSDLGSFRLFLLKEDLSLMIILWYCQDKKDSISHLHPMSKFITKV